MGDWQHAMTASGAVVPLRLYAPEGKAKACVLMLPALGVQAKFYRRLAEGLAENGIATVLFEQRGHGESPYRASRGETFGYREFLQEDIPAAVSWCQNAMPDVPLYLAGHSLGGHFSAIMAGRLGDAVAGVIQVACGFPYHQLYGKKAGGQIRMLARLIPLVTLMYGYFPGARFGFGGREFRRLMMDWREWALGGSYDISATPDAEVEIASYGGRVLAVSFDHDRFASPEAVAYAHSRFGGAEVATRHLTEAEQGKNLGHFEWARDPAGVVREIAGWV